MGKFSKIYHHINKEDLKKVHEQKVLVQKLESERIEEEEKDIKEKFEKIKSDWRAIGFDLKPKSVTENKKTKRKSFKKIMKEAMTTGAIMQQTETETVEVSDIDLTNPVSYTNSITSSAGTSFIDPAGSQYNQGAGIATNGAGVPGSGFNLGSDYLAFAFPPTQEAPTFGRADFGAQDLTNIDTISAFGIRGNITNGGSTPLVGGGVTEPGLRLQYKLSGMGTYVDFNVKPDGSIDNNVENILIPGGIATDSFTAGKNIVINIPSYIRTAQTEIRLITKDIGFHGTPVYGVKNFKFQRRTPQNVFVALDDPEAMSFIRIGQQPSVKRKSAKEREKDVVNLLKGGRDYTDKILGMQFPGSNPELSFSTDLPDQDIADIQQQQRSQTFNQIKDRFASDPGIDGRIQSLRATQSPTSQISYQDYNNFETHASVMPSYETSIVNVNQSFDDFANENGQKLSGGNDELINDVKSKFTPLTIKQSIKEPILTPEKGPAIYASSGSIEDLLKSPNEPGYKETFITQNGETYTLARRVRDENGKPILDAQYKAIDKAMRQATADYNKSMMDAKYEMGVAYYKQSVELQIKNFEKLTPRQQARRTRPRYNEAQARARGKNYQKNMPNYDPENITDPLLKSYHEKFGTEEARDFLRPFREAQEALNNKIVRVDNQAPYGLYKGGLRDNPEGEIVLPFTKEKIPTAAKREKEIDDLFKELESGESGSDSDVTTNQPEPSNPSKEQIKKLDGGITLKWVPGLETGDPNTRIPGNWTDITDYPKDTGFLNYADYMTGRAQSPSSDTNVDSGTETKPQGLSRVLAGIADIITKDKFDFDKRGSSAQALMKAGTKLPGLDRYQTPVNTMISYDKFLNDMGKNKSSSDIKGATANNRIDITNNISKKDLKYIESNMSKLSSATSGDKILSFNNSLKALSSSNARKSDVNAAKETIKQEFSKIYLDKAGLVSTFGGTGEPGTGKNESLPEVLNVKETDEYYEVTMGKSYAFRPGGSAEKANIFNKILGVEPDTVGSDSISGLGAPIAAKLGITADDKFFKKKDDPFSLYNSPEMFYSVKFKVNKNKKKKVNESSTYNRIKNKFFNQKDIKPTFPENPPPEMVNGLHPEYGKRANRYNKLDPISANSMPLTGDPEIDAVVKKQKTFKKFKRNIK